MPFIAKNPLILPEIRETPSTPPGTRGLFAKEDGWYEVDSNGVVKKLGDASGGFTPEAIDEMIETVEKMESMLPRKVYINLPASAWVEDDDGDYSQVVTIENTPSHFEVDLQPSKEQLSAFKEKDITFLVELENGVVTVFCMGQKPTNDYAIQAKVTGVLVDG